MRTGSNEKEEILTNLHTHTHTHPFNGPLSGTTRVSRYQKGKTDLDFTEARDIEWQWHQLGKSASRSRHIAMPVPHHSSFLHAGCPSCRPTNSVKALNCWTVAVLLRDFLQCFDPVASSPQKRSLWFSAGTDAGRTPRRNQLTQLLKWRKNCFSFIFSFFTQI